MKKGFPTILAFVSAISLAGCLRVGRPFPVDLVPTIELNQTSQSQLLGTFGDPHRTGIDDGDETWTYVDYKLSAFGSQMTRDLYVRFNKDGTVKSYSFNSSVPEDRELARRKR